MCHLTFLPQLLLLLRARCAYCGHLKLNKKDAHTFRCKFRLIQHGLLKEVKGLEDYIPQGKGAKVNGVETQVDGEDKIGEDNTEPEDEDLLEERRETFVRRAIKKAIKQNEGGSSRQNIESISESRRAIAKEFFADAPKIRKCGTCKGYLISINRWSLAYVSQNLTRLATRQILKDLSKIFDQD